MELGQHVGTSVPIPFLGPVLVVGSGLHVSTMGARRARACAATPIAEAAVDAASPELRIASHLPHPPKGRMIVVGAGNASATMKAWPEPLSGLVVTRYGHAVPCERIDILEAARPVAYESG